MIPKFVRFTLAAAIAISFIIAAAVIVMEYWPDPANADEPAYVPTRQSVMIGPFPDGRVVWCKGYERDGKMVIADTDASSCRMDTSDVAATDPNLYDCGDGTFVELPFGSCKFTGSRVILDGRRK